MDQEPCDCPWCQTRRIIANINNFKTNQKSDDEIDEIQLSDSDRGRLMAEYPRFRPPSD